MTGRTNTLSREDALAIIKQAARDDVVVLGVEGFEERGSGIVPRMDLIGDFSGADASAAAESATALILRAPADVVWDVEVEAEISRHRDR